MKNRKLRYSLIGASVILAALAVWVGIPVAEDPTSVKVKVFATALMADQNGQAKTIFLNATGAQVDIVQNAGGAFGNGDVPAGTYERLRLTVENQIVYSGPNPCGGGPLVNQNMLLDDGLAAAAQVELYFATAGDGGSSSWRANGTSATPYLLQDIIEVQSGETTNVNLVFNTSGTLSCISGSPSLSPPTMGVLNYVEERDFSCSPLGQWWFLHYNLRSDIYNATTGRFIVNATETDIFDRTSVTSGWGTMYFDENGNWFVYPGHLYNAAAADNPGMAEHRHYFSEWSHPDDGYLNPIEPSAGDSTMGGTYFVNGRDLIMDMDGGLIHGRASIDCNKFVGINVSGGDGDLIFAIKKPVSPMPSALPTGRIYAISEYQFEIAYDEDDSLGLNAGFGVVNAAENLYSGPGVVLVNTTDDHFSSWGSGVQFMPVYNGTNSDIDNWTVRRPSERFESMSGALSGITMRPDGFVNKPSGDDTFIGIGAGGSGVLAGSTMEKQAQWDSHRMSAGIMIDVSPDAALSDIRGVWYLGMLESMVWPGMDMIFNTGDEKPNFGLTWGIIEIDSNNNISVNFSHKDVLSGEITQDNGGGGGISIEGPLRECYKLGVQNNDIANCGWVDGLGGVTIPIFIIKENLTGAPIARLAVDRSKQVMLFLSPIDSDLKPQAYKWCDIGDVPGVNCCDEANPLLYPNLCGNALPYSQLGVGVKIRQ